MKKSLAKDPLKYLLILLIGILFSIAYHFYTAPDLSINIIVKDDPEITYEDNGRTWKSADITFKELAKVSMRAKVLSTHPYDWLNTWAQQAEEEEETQLSPEDVLLGWGSMSDNNVWTLIGYNKGDHHYSLDIPLAFPLAMDYLKKHANNSHIIPANDHVRETLKHLNINDIIVAHGFLVDVTFTDGQHWVEENQQQGGESQPISNILFFVQDLKVESN
jgi:hypothetical protein